MNKEQLIAEVASRTLMTKKDAASVVDAIFDPEKGIISRSLAVGEDVRLTGFGIFDAPLREAREGRNPGTGEAITIAGGRQVRFKAGSPLKTAVK